MTNFAISIYQTQLFVPGSTDQTQNCYMRTTANALALTIDGDANVPPSGEVVNSQIPVRSSGIRKYGIIARNIVLGRLAGSSPNQLIVRRRIPIFDAELFQATISSLATINFSYEGNSDWKLISAHNERYNLINAL